MLKQKFVLHFATGVIGQVLTALTGILVARWAGPEIVGTVAYGVSFVSIGAFMLGLFGSSHMKLVSEGQDHGNCVRTFSIIQSLNILLFVIIFTTWLLVQIFISDHPFQRNQLWVIIVYFVYFVFSQVLSMWQLNFSATIEVAKNSIPLLLQNILYNSTRIIVVILGFGAIALTASNFAGLLISVPVTWYFVRKLPKGKFNKDLAKKYFSISFVFLVIVLCGTLNKHLGRILLEKYENVKEVGYYTAGYSIAAMLLLISTTSGTIFFPLFSKLVSENNYERINKQIHFFERIILIFLLPPVILISVFATPLIEFLLEAQYHVSGAILSILILTSFVQVVTLPHGNLIAGQGLFKILSFLNIGQVMVFIISLFFFIDHRFMGLGAKGLAWATMISNLFICTAYIVVSMKTARIKSIWLNYKFYLTGLLLYLTVYAVIKYVMSGQMLYKSILMSVLLVIVYYVILYIIKWISREDFRLITDFVNPKKLTEYIKNDLRNK